ncbi:hypothetical protein EYS09_11060 [Streptomyces kasugaensis]|uniref:Thioredoxin-like fold domain-containing protein n=1 Tax=Streptomyces kasugaensis TaxID=1946 RepID=A0A4Q9HWS7_STRKA|nr:thioredoxin domain-containing protein [Streptomyces kasugaensis]TBO59626.1 hypothetical protein EYS09_11060 [Streptomyces kasugaensis]
MSEGAHGLSARERLRAERATAAKRTRLRRRLLLVAMVVAVLSLGGVYLTSGDPADEAVDKPLVVPANTSGDQRTSVVHGKPDARRTLTVHTALNCTECHKLEQALGPAMRALADQGAYRIEYRVATAPDGTAGDKSALHAINALGAAANADAETEAGKAGKFIGYLGLLLGEQSASDDRLLALADKVEGLRTPAFDRAVQELIYLPWSVKVDRAHRASREELPATELGGAALPLHESEGRFLTPEAFARHVRERL